MSAVAALAGRRIDAPDAKEARFPLANVARVRERIAAVLRQHQVAALVASAACGADLIALDEAARLGARRRIVLPFPVDKFREKSVTDRPGDWGALYDRLVRDAAQAGDLIVLDTIAGTTVRIASRRPGRSSTRPGASPRAVTTIGSRSPCGKGRRVPATTLPRCSGGSRVRPASSRLRCRRCRAESQATPDAW